MHDMYRNLRHAIHISRTSDSYVRIRARFQLTSGQSIVELILKQNTDMWCILMIYNQSINKFSKSFGIVHHASYIHERGSNLVNDMRTLPVLPQKETNFWSIKVVQYSETNENIFCDF